MARLRFEGKEPTLPADQLKQAREVKAKAKAAAQTAKTAKKRAVAERVALRKGNAAKRRLAAVALREGNAAKRMLAAAQRMVLREGNAARRRATVTRKALRKGSAGRKPRKGQAAAPAALGEPLAAAEVNEIEAWWCDFNVSRLIRMSVTVRCEQHSEISMRRWQNTTSRGTCRSTAERWRHLWPAPMQQHPVNRVTMH